MLFWSVTMSLIMHILACVKNSNSVYRNVSPIAHVVLFCLVVISYCVHFLAMVCLFFPPCKVSITNNVTA